MSDSDTGSLKAIIEWAKIPFKAIDFIFLFASSLLLFSPDEFVEMIYLKEFKSANGAFIGIIWLITLGILIYYIVIVCKELYHQTVITPKVIRERIESLSDVEIRIVLTVYKSPEHCAKLDMFNPVINGLLSKKFCILEGRS